MRSGPVSDGWFVHAAGRVGHAAGRIGHAAGVVGLAAVVLAVLSCQPGGDLSCGDGVSCPDGERCVMTALDDPGMCLPTCSSSASCAAAAPVCDPGQSVCRSCFPGEDAACQKRDAQTPRCGGGHCVQCLSKRADSAQAVECQARGLAAPVCDKERNTCRPCQRHGECDSGVCAKDASGESLGVAQGSCVPVEQVLIVDQNLCTSDGPVFCTVKQALDRVDAQHRYVLLRKSAVASDFTDLQIGSLPALQSNPLWLIGPTADVAPASVSSPPTVSLGGVATKDALTITSSRVVVEGLAIRGSNNGVVCQGAKAQVRIVRSLFAGNGTALVAASGCSLSVEQSWFGRGPDGSAFAGAASATKNARSLDVSLSDFWVTNSVFVDNGDSRVDGFGGVRVRSLSIAGATGPRSGIVNSTFLQQSGLIKNGKYYTGVLCDAAVGDRLVVMNSLFYTDAPLRLMPEDHYIDPSCSASLHRNASNDAILTDDKSLVLPATAMPFVNLTARDLHLGPKLTIAGSSLYDGGTALLELAIDRIPAPSVDMDGRPRGTTISIGAYAPNP